MRFGPWRSAAAFAAIGALIALLGVWWFGRFQPDPASYPVRGVDVSHHQGSIDWRRVAADHVTFAYIKATEGGSLRDRAFDENWRAARQAGIAVGAYHYFSLCRPGRAQAENFLAAAPYSSDALPAAVDLEFGGNCPARPSGQAMRRELDRFLSAVEARDGRPAVLYVTPEFYSKYQDDLPPRALWRRSILLKPEGGWTLWQYHNRGRVAGVRGPVDLSVFVGGPLAFVSFARAKHTMRGAQRPASLQ